MDEINEWLEEIDCEGELELLSNRTSKNKYYRLKSSMHHGLVIDFSSGKEAFSSFLKLNLPLYEAGVHVAKVFTYNREECFVFMEDLGNTHLCDVTAGDFELFYDKAIDAIVKMQNVETEELALHDGETLLAEMNAMQTFYVEKHLNISLSEEQKEALKKVFENIKEEVLGQPKEVFVHADYQSNNLMFDCSDSIVVTEYQGGKVGAITYDLASLLRDVHMERDLQDVERLALSFKNKKGLDVDDETFLRWFDFSGIQRHLMLLGVNSKAYMEDGYEEHLQTVPLTLKYLLEVASKYTQTADLVEILKEI